MARKSVLLDEKVVLAIDKKLKALGGLDFSAYVRHLIAEDLKNPAQDFLKNSYAEQFSTRTLKLTEAQMIGVSAAVETLFLCREMVNEMKGESVVKRCTEMAQQYLKVPLEKAAQGE